MEDVVADKPLPSVCNCLPAVLLHLTFTFPVQSSICTTVEPDMFFAGHLDSHAFPTVSELAI